MFMFRARTLGLLLPLFIGCDSDVKVGTFNTPPVATITSHADGDEVFAGAEVLLTGNVSDADGASEALTVTWIIGGLHTCTDAVADETGLTSCAAIIEEGKGDVSLQAKDAGNEVALDSITLVVIPNEAPKPLIISPTDSQTESYYSNVSITFEGSVSDEEDLNPEDLLVNWNSDLDGDLALQAAPDSTGSFTGNKKLSEGTHLITLTATDTVGKTGTDTVTIDVKTDNTNPSCEITAPTPGSAGELNSSVEFQALATDAELEDNLLVVEWSSDKDGPLGNSTPTSNGEVVFAYSDLTAETHTITMTVTDDVGTTCSDLITYTVGTAPTLTITSPASGDSFKLGELISFSAEVADSEDSPTALSLEWSSSRDGVFNSQGADSTGVAQFQDDSLSEGTHALTVTVTDSTGLYASAIGDFEVVANSAPSITSVSIDPDPAYVDDTLTCSYSGFNDPDGDPDASTIEWKISGSVVGSGATLSGSFAKGDTVKCTVTPSDGTDDGSSLSASLTISNSLPSISDVSISPSSPLVGDTLSCSYSGFDDADGDGDASSFNWLINGTNVGSGSTLSSGFSGGDSVKCKVTPNDGEDDGSAMSDSATIVNSAPTIATVEISPVSPLDTDTLTCSWTFNDVDGDSDSSTIEWTVGSTVLGTGISLSSGFSAGDIVDCTVIAFDGTDTGNSASDSVTIDASNTAPSVTTVSITPDPANELDTLIAVPSGWFDAEGDGEDYVYEWTVDSSVVGGDTLTLDSSYTAIGSVVTVTITPDDGLLYGSPVTSSPLTIEDSCVPGGAWAVSTSLCRSDYSFVGENADDNAGYSVSSAGDVDGDGLADLLVGAFNNDDGGKTYLILGSSLGATSSIDLSQADYSFIGENAEDYSGFSVSSAGDVDGDGLDDLLFGALGNDDGGDLAGKAYLILGSSLGATSSIDLSQADYSFIGENAGDESGISVSSAGDVDDDGLDDLLVGAIYNDDGGSDAGKTYLILGSSLGATSSIDLSQADYSFIGENAEDYSGVSVSSAGDVDGDGLDDLLVGAFGNADGGVWAGKTYLILGSSLGATSSIDLSQADYSFIGENTGDISGYSVSSAGDVDGDGLDDLLVGARGNDDGATRAGKTYLILGSSLGATSSIDLSSADYSFVGENEDDSAGISVASAGDVDGDGLDDLLVGAYSDVGILAGKAYLVLGSSLGATSSIDLSSADYSFIGENADDNAGYSVSSAGDVDGDGLADLLVGAYLNDDGGSSAGKTYLLISPFNAPPLAPTVAISPTDPLDTEDLLCSVTDPAVDPDGDTITDYTFVFLVDGVQLGYDLSGGDEFDTLTVPASVTSPGEVWSCAVWADDGVAAGPGHVGWDEVTIITPNTAPSVTTVSITPDPAHELDTLTAVPSGWFDAEGDGEDYLYEWTVDSSVVGGDTLTLDSSYTAIGSVVTVTITPDDGLLYGSPVMSSELTIGDSCVPGGAWALSSSLCRSDFSFVGENAEDSAGVSVSSAGDVDGDGLADLLVGASYNDDGGSEAGKVYLLLGSSLGATSSIDLSSADYSFNGENADDRAGYSVSSAGDVDGDGLDDLLVGAPENDDGGGDAGKAYLILGKSLGVTSSIDLSSADYSFVGENANDQAGISVSSAGDVDGDGLADLLVGAMDNADGGSQAGKTYLILGKSLGATSSIDLSQADYSFIGESWGDFAGYSVSSAGDVDGDGLDDLLIGAHGNDDGGNYAGKGYLILGKNLGATSSIDLSQADYSFIGENTADYAGYSVSSAGDVDGDGLADLLVGAYYRNSAGGNYAGEAYLILGSSLGATSSIDLSSADYSFTGENPSTYAGWSVSSAGDVDGDGLDDLLVGALYNDDGGSSAGKTYLILGSSLGATSSIDLSQADYSFIGENADDYSGYSVSSAGDVDGDGLDDLLVGAPGNADGGSSAGKTYLLLSQFNAPPLAPTVAISPTAPLDTEDLLCSVTDPAVDPDGDMITDYSFDFLVDGQPSGYGFSGGDEFDTLTVLASVTSPGEVWTCQVWADDAVALGPGHVGSDEVTVLP